MRQYSADKNERGGMMKRNIFIRQYKLHDVRGKINYISSTAKQENLYAVYETTDREFWKNLSRENQSDFKRSGAEGKCIEARELVIALPEEFIEYEPNELLRDFTEVFKAKYGVECIAALHHNKAKTNYHIHLIYSERRVLDEPVIKRASRNMFYDESGKHVRTKKEIMGETGAIRQGCKVITKGEIYEQRLFEKKDPLFKTKSFVKEVKLMYAEKMNEQLKDCSYSMQVFNKESPYLPTKKIGKNNPKAKVIRENNKQRMNWNKTVSAAIQRGIPSPVLVEVKRVEVTEPIKAAVKEHGTATDLLMRIIQRAAMTLARFISQLIMHNAVEKAKPGEDKFYQALDFARVRMPGSRSREWER